MIRERNRTIGLAVILGGFLLLLGLRWWTSPLTQQATGMTTVNLSSFLLIPVFLVCVAVGISLFLWEPDAR